jgi:hypothetical protein
MTEATIFTAIKDVGVTAVVIVLCMWGIWKVVVPALIKDHESQNEYYVKEIQALRTESWENKKLMFDSFSNNTAAITKFQMTVEAISTQLDRLIAEVTILNQDVNRLSERNVGGQTITTTKRNLSPRISD